MATRAMQKANNPDQIGCRSRDGRSGAGRPATWCEGRRTRVAIISVAWLKAWAKKAPTQGFGSRPGARPLVGHGREAPSRTGARPQVRHWREALGHTLAPGSFFFPLLLLRHSFPPRAAEVPKRGGKKSRLSHGQRKRPAHSGRGRSPPSAEEVEEEEEKEEVEVGADNVERDDELRAELFLLKG